MVIILQQLFGVKVRHVLAADRTRKYILIGINKRVNASISELVDHGLNFVKEGVAIGASSVLSGLPHDAKTNEVHAPFLEAGNIFADERVLRIEITDRRDEWLHLVENVNTIELNLSAFAIKKVRLPESMSMFDEASVAFAGD